MKKKAKNHITQSCDSRDCNKKYKSEINDMCRAVTTVHEINHDKKILTCTICKKKTKFS